MSDQGQQRQPPGGLVTVTAWAAVGLAAIAVAGMVAARSLLALWIILLVLAITAVPQALFHVRRERRAHGRR